jgi:RNA polymerase sigma factor (sigma-70 family)
LRNPKNKEPIKRMSDEELVEGCLKNDKASQDYLYKKYASKMFGLCIRYSNTREEAEDVLQEGFIKVFNKIDRFKHEGSFEGWIRRIMINTALKSKDKRILKYENTGLENVREPKFESQVLGELNRKELIGIIDRLPEGYRVVFNLFAVEGYPHKEIAQMLQISEGTSRSQYSRARQSLIKIIEKIYTN